MLRQSKRIHNKDQKTIATLRKEQISERLQIQQEILSELAQQPKVVSESEIDELLTIQGVEEVLHVIQELDILSRPYHQEKYHSFALQLKQFRERVMTKKSVGMDVINQMVVSLQDFIAELKPVTQEGLEARSMRNSSEMQMLSSNTRRLS